VPLSAPECYFEGFSRLTFAVFLLAYALSQFFRSFPALIAPEGAIVVRIEANGSDAVATYSAIHLKFGLMLAAASATYLFSRDMPPRSVSTI
jgi:hypothetical protein